MGCCERQAGLQGRHIPLRLILSCQQTHDSWSHAGPGGPACCGPAPRSGRGRLLCAHHSTGKAEEISAASESGALCSLPRRGGRFCLCPAPSSADGRGPRLSPSWPPGPPLQTAPFVWSSRQKERKRSGGCEQKGLQWGGEKEEGAFLFPFLRANKINGTLHRPEHF